MELTVTEALQKGIEAHKAGRAQEADLYYSAILKVQPKHPDANHNMGILAVSVGKAHVALTFLRTAVEANPNIDQYWLSHIETLIKLDKFESAIYVLNQAKEKGMEGFRFNKIEEQLASIKSTKNTKEKTEDPSQDQLKPIITFYSQGQFQQALDVVTKLLQSFPSSVILYNIQGLANRSLGQIDDALASYNKALSFKPDYAEAYYNLGNALKDQDKPEEAIDAYKKALSIKPSIPKLGLSQALIMLGDYQAAIDAIVWKVDKKLKRFKKRH